MTLLATTSPMSRSEATALTRPESAVVWIDSTSALVAEMDRQGRISTCAIDRGNATDPEYLDLVIHAIGGRERVVIMGPGPARLELERAYVAVERRPDRLVDVEPAGPMDEAALVDRLRELAG
jgi:hypothetical protein